MALLHFPSVGKCSVEIAKANSFIFIFNTPLDDYRYSMIVCPKGENRTQNGRKRGTNRLRRKWATSRGASLNPIITS